MPVPKPLLAAVKGVGKCPRRPLTRLIGETLNKANGRTEVNSRW
jgi:hypothetical protein